MSSEAIFPVDRSSLKGIAAEIQANLRSSYLRIQSPKAAWLHDLNRPVSDYHFRLKLCLQSCWMVTRTPIYVPIQDLFDPVDDIIRPRRIWIEGPAGYGKTSLALKLAQDWAKGEKYMAKNFDFVFVLRKRWLCTKPLDEVLHELCNGEGDPTQTTSAIDLARARVLLIIDDYTTEEDSRPNDDALALLRCETHQEMTVIFTSREGCYQNENVTSDIDNFIQKRISVDGVALGHLETFLQDNFVDMPDRTVEDVSSQMRTFTDKWFGTSVCKCPLLLLLLAAASIEDRFEASQTRTEMYVTLLNFIIRRNMRKMQESPQNCSYYSIPFNAESVPDNLLVRLGKFAANAIVKERFRFEQKTILSHCGNEALRSGLFILCKALPGDSLFDDSLLYECLHSTILEFIAAHYLCYLYVNKKWKKFRNLLKSLWVCCNSKNLVIPFVVGMLPSIAPEIFATIKPWLRDDLDNFGRLTTVLHECNISKDLTDVVIPLLPESWVIDDSDFCQTSIHATLLDHGLIAQKVKRVSWNVSCPIRLQLLHEIPKLDLFGPMSHLDPRCLVGLQCDELCFKLKYEDPSCKGPRNGWENVVSTTKHVQANRVSFYIDDNVDTMLTLLCNQATSGQLQYINIGLVDCVIVMNKNCVASLATLISKEKLTSLHLTLLHFKTSADSIRRVSVSSIHLLQISSKTESYAKKEMRSLIKCAGKSTKLEDLVLVTEHKYMQYIDMKLLCNKGKKVWNTLRIRTTQRSDIPKYSVSR